MLLYRWKHPTTLVHTLGFLQGFGKIMDGIVILFSLGFCASGFELMASRYRAKLFFKQQKRIRAKP